MIVSLFVEQWREWRMFVHGDCGMSALSSVFKTSWRRPCLISANSLAELYHMNFSPDDESQMMLHCSWVMVVVISTQIFNMNGQIMPMSFFTHQSISLVLYLKTGGLWFSSEAHLPQCSRTTVNSQQSIVSSQQSTVRRIVYPERGLSRLKYPAEHIGYSTGPPVRNFDCGGQTLPSGRLAVINATFF